MTPDGPGRLVELTERECWDFLAQHQVGRLVWVEQGRPHVVPLNYVPHDEAIWVRTAAYTRMAREVSGARVAFEVDDIDRDAHAGTSVVVEGTAQPELEVPDELAVPEPWAEGSRRMVLRITAIEISGRRVLPR